MMTEAFTQLAKEFKKRDNPSSLKEGVTGTVLSTAPLCVSLADGAITLKEGERLIVCEWFKFRCDIDKTGVLSNTVPSNTNNAESITESHSYGGASCNMPSAVSALAEAILGVRDELLNLKCDLKAGDLVALLPTENNGYYFLIDKITR